MVQSNDARNEHRNVALRWPVPYGSANTESAGEARLRAWIWVVGLTIGCGPSTDELVSELSEWGAYNVGYTETQVNYAPRDGSGERTLRLATWYPTNDATGVEPKYRDLFDAPDVWASAAPAEGPRPEDAPAEAPRQRGAHLRQRERRRASVDELKLGGRRPRAVADGARPRVPSL